MPRYVVLVNYTHEGITNVKGALDRLEANRKAFEDMGVRIVDFYWTMGQYDMVAVMEAPDDETAEAAAMAYGTRGTGRSLTMRAFSPQEMSAILDKVPG
ncbi:MAG: GYD domain-containing protein [Burkholderiales bacterium]|nr:MAG: GYD domain-containing protein [Burkholderiales bacterium]